MQEVRLVEVSSDKSFELLTLLLHWLVDGRPVLQQTLGLRLHQKKQPIREEKCIMGTGKREERESASRNLAC